MSGGWSRLERQARPGGDMGRIDGITWCIVGVFAISVAVMLLFY